MSSYFLELPFSSQSYEKLYFKKYLKYMYLHFLSRRATTAKI